MKICEIIDESRDNLLIAYLFYFEKSKEFCVELSPDVRQEDAPIFLASFIGKGRLTLDPEWSMRWVESRIVPTDRQNLGTILRANGLSEYDPFRLLMLGDGRCAQDDCAVRMVRENDLPDWVRQRMLHKVSFAVRIRRDAALICFADGSISIFDTDGLSGEIEKHPGGLGIRTDRGEFISAEDLYKNGTKLPLGIDEFRTAAKSYLMDTAEVCAELGCTRQYVDQLVRKNLLSTINKGSHNRLYLRPEVERLRD